MREARLYFIFPSLMSARFQCRCTVPVLGKNCKTACVIIIIIITCVIIIIVVIKPSTGSALQATLSQITTRNQQITAAGNRWQFFKKGIKHLFQLPEVFRTGGYDWLPTSESPTCLNSPKLIHANILSKKKNFVESDTRRWPIMRVFLVWPFQMRWLLQESLFK